MWNALNSSIYHIYRMITYDNKVLIIIINNSLLIKCLTHNLSTLLIEHIYRMIIFHNI